MHPLKVHFSQHNILNPSILHLLTHSPNKMHLVWIIPYSCLETSLGETPRKLIFNKIQVHEIKLRLKIWQFNYFSNRIKINQDYYIWNQNRNYSLHGRRVLLYLPSPINQYYLLKGKQNENIISLLLLAKRPLENLWKDGRENKGAYVSDFFISTATSKAHVINNFLKHKINSWLYI